LEKYTGITYEDASNIAEIEAVILALTPKEAEYIDGRKMSCDEINRASGVFL